RRSRIDSRRSLTHTTGHGASAAHSHAHPGQYALAESLKMFTDLKVGTRLALAFGAVLLLLVGMAVTGITRLSVVNDHLHAITDEIDVEARDAKEIRS